MRTYVALASVKYKNADGQTVTVNPVEGRAAVFSAKFTDTQEERLIAAGAIRKAVGDDGKEIEGEFTVIDEKPIVAGAGDAPEDLSKLTVPKLRELATAENIDLGKITAKPEIVAAIEKARTERAAAEQVDGAATEGGENQTGTETPGTEGGTEGGEKQTGDDVFGV